MENFIIALLWDNLIPVGMHMGANTLVLNYKWHITFHVAVLAMAYGSSQSDMIFVGMVGIMDPPKEGVKEAISLLQSNNINIKMVTGDAEETAISIGKSPCLY